MDRETREIVKRKIRVSVVVPAYNREKTIERCIQSIKRQTMQPYEIVLVDDGSTDQTVRLAEGIPCKYLKILRQNHKGAQAARNLGILNAKGNYIAFLDSDDEWLPEMLEREIEYLLQRQNNCVLYSDCYIYDDKGKRVWRRPGRTGNTYHESLLQGGPMFQSMLVKKSLLYKIGLLDEKVAAYQEGETAIRLAKRAEFVHIREPLFIYYCHSGETISKDIKKGIQGYLYIVKKFQKDIVKVHGFGGLAFHYKNLMDSSRQCKNKLIVVFWIKTFCYNRLSKLDQFIKNRDN